MECSHVRELLSEYASGRLDAAARATIATHLEACEACRRDSAIEAALSAALEQRLPRHAAPAALHRRLRQQFAGAPSPVLAASQAVPVARSWTRAWRGPFVSACAAAALVLVATRAFSPHRASALQDLVAEAVNDHLRVVASTHPVGIESGGIHQVKPWFTGRVDFAPRVDFSGDDEFPLVGGSVGYFRERRAAVFVFRRRLHLVTLLALPVDGLAWPEGAPQAAAARGFSVLLWKKGPLGYALVSDVNTKDLEVLAAKIHAD